MNKFVTIWYYASLIIFAIAVILIFTLFADQVNISTVERAQEIVNVGHAVAISAISLMLSILADSFVVQE